jgi:hypothetical protein
MQLIVFLLATYLSMSMGLYETYAADSSESYSSYSTFQLFTSAYPFFIAVFIALGLYAAFLVSRMEKKVEAKGSWMGISFPRESLQISKDGFLAQMGKILGRKSVSFVNAHSDTWMVGTAYNPLEQTNFNDRLIPEFASELWANQRLSTRGEYRHYPSFSQRLQSVWTHLLGPQPTVAALVNSYRYPRTDLVVLECLTPRGERSPVGTTPKLTVERVPRQLEGDARFVEVATPTRSVRKAGGSPVANSLSRDVVHEFNNLLTAIMGYAEMTAGSLDPKLPTYDYVANIIDAGNKVRVLVNNLDSFGRDGGPIKPARPS